jgi:myo-inositol-1-phosphate synthase
METKTREYYQALTPLQRKAFYKLLENKLREAGYYSRNATTNEKVTQLQREAVKGMAEKFDSLKASYQNEKDQLEQQIKELQEKRNQLWETFRTNEDKLYNEAYLTVEDKVKEVQEERGDSTGERLIIESLTIAEYQKRLDKRAKQLD